MSTVQLSSDNKSVSLSGRKNIKDHEDKRQKYLEEIEKATGVSGWTYDFEGDLGAFNNALEKAYKDRLGEILFDVYLKEIAELLTKQLKDDLVKEAVLEATPTKKVLFVPQPENSPEDQKVEFKNGALIVGCHPSKVWYNIALISNTKLEKLL